MGILAQNEYGREEKRREEKRREEKRREEKRSRGETKFKQNITEA